MGLDEVLEVLAALEAAEVRYAVFGGLAMAAHGLDEIVRLRAGELEISVVSVRTLYAMKRDTVRPRDRDDAARLRHRFNLDDGGTP